MLPKSFIDQVKQSTNMLQLAKRHTELVKVGDGIWQGRCPHPEHNDSGPSFTVWEKEQSWACMGCHQGKKNPKHKNYGSDCFAFIQWMSEGKTGWKDAILQLAEEVGVPVPTDENQKLYDHQKLLAKSYLQSMHGPAFNYLLSRGLSRLDMQEWMLGFDGKRITFPLFDRYRNVLGFTKRWLQMPEGRHDKYRNSPGSKIFNKSYYFYGIHLVDMDFKELRITEGPMDVITASKYKARNMVGTLGTSFTTGHIELIKSYGMIPVFCMDGDPAGLRSTKKSIDALAEAGVYSKLLILPPGKDMAELALDLREDLEAYIQDHAITYGFYQINELISQYEAKTNELKLKMYPALQDLFQDIPVVERHVLRDLVWRKLELWMDEERMP